MLSPVGLNQCVVGISNDISLIATGERLDASPRDRIRAAECLVKLDALNIQREAMDKAKRLELHVVPPAYAQMSDQANREMVSYLQQVALSEHDVQSSVLGDECHTAVSG